MERGAMSTLFFILALIGVVVGVVVTIMITSSLARRGTKINYLFLRVLIPKYVQQYREITTKETVEPGPLFYPFIAAWSLALLFAIIGMILELT
jgi:hypothetical protein